MSIKVANSATSTIDKQNNINDDTSAQKIQPDSSVSIIDEAKKSEHAVSEDAGDVEISAKLTIANFKQIIEKDFGALDKIKNEEDKNKIKSKFRSMVNEMSCDEIENNLKSVISEYSKYPEFLDIYLAIFKEKDAKRAQEYIDNQITYEDLLGYESEAVNIIIKYRSIPGTEKLSAENEAKAKELYINYTALIEGLFKDNPSEQEINERINALTDLAEKKAAEDYCKCLNINVMIVNDAATNKEKYGADLEAANDIICKVNNSAKEMAGYNLFIEKVAEFISKNPDNLIIDKDKLTEIFDESSEGKFSEIMKKIAEENAVDETGKFKTTSPEEIAKSEEKIQAILQSITDTSTPEQIIVEPIEHKEKAEVKEANATADNVINYEAITGENGLDIIKSIFTGELKVSEYIEQVAIKHYKLLNDAMKGNILLSATGEFFDDLVKNLETSTFEHLLSVGWKGRSYVATKQVKDEVEKRRENAA